MSRLFFASAFIFNDLREKQYLSVPIVVPITFFLRCFPEPAFGPGPSAILTLKVTKVNSTTVSNRGEAGLSSWCRWRAGATRLDGRSTAGSKSPTLTNREWPRAESEASRPSRVSKIRPPRFLAGVNFWFARCAGRDKHFVPWETPRKNK